MPRGKRTVFAAFCTGAKCHRRITTLRFHKQDKQGIAWKEHAEGLEKFCKDCRKKMPVKCKEERHSK
jgi:hypothetical protein